ncbi:MAG: hypothetical protein AAB795_01175 [Patescibacteria group bacterium]
MNSFNNKNGYSLIETVVYVALIAVMLIISTSSIISVYRTFGVLRTERKISINGETAIETMIRDIRAATSTSVTSSVFGTNPGVLRMNSIKFSLNGTTQLYKQDGSNSPQPITGSDVRVTNLVFYRAQSPVVLSELITVNMTIEAGGGSFTKSVPFSGSAVLRGSYK